MPAVLIQHTEAAVEMHPEWIVACPDCKWSTETIHSTDDVEPMRVAYAHNRDTHDGAAVGRVVSHTQPIHIASHQLFEKYTRLLRISIAGTIVNAMFVLALLIAEVYWPLVLPMLACLMIDMFCIGRCQDQRRMAATALARFHGDE